MNLINKLKAFFNGKKTEKSVKLKSAALFDHLGVKQLNKPAVLSEIFNEKPIGHEKSNNSLPIGF
jgi:hypothetical protein